MKEKKNEGITLIALVITIIVLLILAGVTLSTLFGNNGILTESKLAVEANKEANAKEQVQLAWMGCETEYQSAWTQDSSVVKKDYFDPDDLNRNLGTGKVNSVDYVENGKSTVTYTLDGTEYEFEIANGQAYKVGEAPDVTEPTQPEVTSGNLAKIITAKNYGDYINYNVDLNDDSNNANDWRIFYNDGDNVFLIASKNIPSSKIPEIETMEIDGPYNDEVYWNEKVKENVGASGIDETVARKFGLNWIFTGNHRNSTNTNIKCVQDLMNTSYWKSFATGVNGAQAIGGPTIEMWINSWNQKNPNLKLIYNDGRDRNSDGSVYETYIGVNPDSGLAEYWDSVACNQNMGYQYCFDANLELPDSLKKYYCNFTSGMNINEGNHLSASGEFYNDISCWLASPSASVFGVEDDDICTTWSYNSYPALGHNCYNWSFNLQPVVCLPSNVNATKSGDVWTINQ